jgi:hypothetical protein
LRQAKAHLLAADLMINQNADVSASDSVLAGIAAADALCCHHLRIRSADGDHGRAVEMLGSIDGAAAAKLRKLLAMKTRAQYDVATVAQRDAKAARRLAGDLVELAETTLRLGGGTI